MKKAILFCHSVHHGNTRKLAEAAAARLSVALVSLPCGEIPDIAAYELVGFLSGIYMSDFGKPVYALIDALDLSGKACFTAYTSGADSGKFAKKIETRLTAKGARIAGSFHCRGFDTFGPFRLVGGIAKGHPDEADIEAFVRFLEGLMCEAPPS